MVKYFPNVKKSESDKFEYRALQLDNGLMVYLVRDPECQKGAASVAVHVGTYRDPKDHQGLAHFLEHMLFCGSEKYPGEGEYMTFLGQNGGYSNAYTTNFYTNYFHEVKDDQIPKAMDMLAQFFIAPLLRDDSVFKEINAVNSEAEKNYNNQYRRMDDIHRLLCDQNSVKSKYSTGNLDTLGDLRGHIPLQSDKKEGETGTEGPSDPAVIKRKDLLVHELKELHKKYYSANQMTLALYSKMTLDDQEKLITTLFTPVQNKNIEYEGFKDSLFPFPKNTTGKFLKVVPVSKGSTLMVVFYLKECSRSLVTKSHNYIEYLLNNKSDRSLINLLSEEDLAVELKSYLERYEDYYSELTIEVQLTSNGAKKENLRKVISAIGSYLNLMRETGAEEWVYEEMKTLNKIDFKYKDSADGVSTVVDLCSTHIELNDPENVLSNQFEYSSFDKGEIEGIMAQLTLDHANVLFCSTEELKETDKYSKDPIYQTVYHAEPIRDEVRKAFEQGDTAWSTHKLSMPEKNNLIPTEFALKQNEKPEDTPVRVKEDEITSVWHWQDTKYLLPKVEFSLDILLKQETIATTARKRLLLSLWTSLLEDFNRSMNYIASVAKINSELEPKVHGLTLNISCYDQSLKPYLVQFLDSLVSFQNSEIKISKFESIKEKKERELVRCRDKMPYQHISASSLTYMRTNMYTNEELLVEIEKITYEDLTSFSKQVFAEARFEILIEGNITKEESVRISEEIVRRFITENGSKPLSPSDTVTTRVLKLQPKEVKFVEMVNHIELEKNVGFLRLYQIENGDSTAGILKFLGTWLGDEYFEELRTQQQLGYAVGAYQRKINFTVNYFSFLIQSDVKSSHYCVERTLLFIAQYYQKLKDMSPENFEQIRAGTIAGLREPIKTLGELAANHSEEIRHRQYKFDRNEWVATKVEKITKEEVLLFYEEYFIANPRCLELHQYSHPLKDESIKQREERQTSEPGFKFYPSANALKRSCELFAGVSE